MFPEYKQNKQVGRKYPVSLRIHLQARILLNRMRYKHKYLFNRKTYKRVYTNGFILYVQTLYNRYTNVYTSAIQMY